jgi:hypothetical protein
MDRVNALFDRARSQAEQRARALSAPQQENRPPPVSANAPLHYADALTQLSAQRLRSLTSMTMEELETAIRLLKPFFNNLKHRGTKNIFGIEDAIFIILSWFTTAMTFEELAAIFQTDNSTLHRVVQTHLSTFSKAACQLWMPTQVTDEREAQQFTNFPEAIGAVDATLIRVRIPTDPNLRTELWSAKHKQHGFKLQILVAPNEICLRASNLRKGNVHDKRIFDESALPVELKYRRELGRDNVVEARHACLFDTGYIGVQRYYPEAILTTRKPVDRELTDEEVFRNSQIHSDRVVVEHFFGHMKMHYGILFDEVRVEHHLLEAIVFATVALTNYLTRSRSGDPRPLHIIHNPDPVENLPAQDPNTPLLPPPVHRSTPVRPQAAHHRRRTPVNNPAPAPQPRPSVIAIDRRLAKRFRLEHYETSSDDEAEEDGFIDDFSGEQSTFANVRPKPLLRIRSFWPPEGSSPWAYMHMTFHIK